MEIEAKLKLGEIIINGLTILEAIPVEVLHDVLGKPDRIDAGAPAPAGHRNNQIHVYDSLGFYFYEHHFTTLATAMVFVFWPEEQTYSFTPTHAFKGRLVVAGYEVPAEVTERDMAQNTKLPCDNRLKGTWRFSKNDFSIGFDTIGARLRSGRRSTVRRVVNIDASWPHDPWQRPG